MDAFYVGGSLDKGGVEELTRLDYFLHFLSFFWKVLFAFVPPPVCIYHDAVEMQSRVIGELLTCIAW